MIASFLTIDGNTKGYHAIVIGQYSDYAKSGLILIAILTVFPYLVLIVPFGLKGIELWKI